MLEEWSEKLDKNFLLVAVLIDPSKAFDWIPRDLIIAKLATYKTEREIQRMIYSYLKGRKQYAKINNTYSDYNEIISDVPQCSILRPILFNLSINDLFLFIEIYYMHNFPNDNTLSTRGETVSELIDTLESESNIAIDWFTNSSPLFLIKRNILLTIDNQTIKSVSNSFGSQVKL